MTPTLAYPSLPAIPEPAAEPSPLTNGELLTLPMSLKTLRAKMQLDKPHKVRVRKAARNLLDAIESGEVTATDEDKMAAWARDSVSVWPDAPARPRRFRGGIRPHAIDRYTQRVHPGIDRRQAEREMRILAAKATRKAEAPEWVYGSLLTAEGFTYLCPTDDIAFAVQDGTIHTVVTQQGSKYRVEFQEHLRLTRETA